MPVGMDFADNRVERREEACTEKLVRWDYDKMAHAIQTGNIKVDFLNELEANLVERSEEWTFFENQSISDHTWIELVKTFSEKARKFIEKEKTEMNPEYREAVDFEWQLLRRRREIKEKFKDLPDDEYLAIKIELISIHVKQPTKKLQSEGKRVLAERTKIFEQELREALQKRDFATAHALVRKIARKGFGQKESQLLDDKSLSP